MFIKKAGNFLPAFFLCLDIRDMAYYFSIFVDIPSSFRHRDTHIAYIIRE